ncbi:MAG: hypothetical protein GY847_32355 [Proteobacteria bacterium]|nr:hypothetical protein [Pseudomonadota bacterium]
MTIHEHTPGPVWSMAQDYQGIAHRIAPLERLTVTFQKVVVRFDFFVVERFIPSFKLSGNTRFFEAGINSASTSCALLPRVFEKLQKKQQMKSATKFILMNFD